jgi:hypothetical protein
MFNFIRAGIAASAFVTRSVASFITKGAASLGNTISSSIAAGAQSLRSSVAGKVESWSSISAQSLKQRITRLFDARIARIRSVNPRSVIKDSYEQKNTYKTGRKSDSGQGFDEFADVCDVFANNITNIISIEATQSAEEMRTRLMQYPDQLANSKYNRTFELQHGWQTAMVAFDIDMTFSGDNTAIAFRSDTSVTLATDVPYAKWVQRRATQMPIHRGRWNTVEDVAEQAAPDFINRVENLIRDLIAN